jgi:hypothetical protein
MHDTLRAADEARQIEWSKGDRCSLSYAGNELAGEFGELADLITEWAQPADDDLQDEIGDVYICLDLVCVRIGGLPTLGELAFGAQAAMPAENWATGEPAQTRFWLATKLGAAVGKICNILKKLEREERGMVGSRSPRTAIAQPLGEAVIWLERLTRRCNPTWDAIECAHIKFNKTSEKYGLRTRVALVAQREDEHADAAG